jgi:hypothetical protein
LLIDDPREIVVLSVVVDSRLFFVVADAPMARRSTMRPAHDHRQAFGSDVGRMFIAIEILPVTNTLTVNLYPDRVMPKRRNENTLEFYRMDRQRASSLFELGLLISQVEWPFQPRLQKQQRHKRSGFAHQVVAAGLVSRTRGEHSL